MKFGKTPKVLNSRDFLRTSLKYQGKHKKIPCFCPVTGKSLYDGSADFGAQNPNRTVEFAN